MHSLDVLPSPCGRPHSLRTSYLHDQRCLLAPRALGYVMGLVDDGWQGPDVDAMYRERFACPRIALDTTGVTTFDGPKYAPVTVIEFFDFKCPKCRSLQVILDRVLRDVTTYHDHVKIVPMSFPLHFYSDEIAAAALAAGRQGKYRPFAKRLFAAPDTIDATWLSALARDLNLDMNRFADDWPKARKQVNREQEIGQHLRPPVQATPTVFVNGCRLRDADALEERLQDELLRVE